jgi:large subunit ribosomal protein L15
VELQASLALLQDTPNYPKEAPTDPHGRSPFEHPALEGLDNLTGEAKRSLMSKRHVANLAQTYGLQKVMRWTPKKVCLRR